MFSQSKVSTMKLDHYDYISMERLFIEINQMRTIKGNYINGSILWFKIGLAIMGWLPLTYEVLLYSWLLDFNGFLRKVRRL